MADGRYAKFSVRKRRGRNGWEEITGCFVLRPDRDPAARVALAAYANACASEGRLPQLVADLRAWLAVIPEPAPGGEDARSQGAGQ
jgi:hypothetical protein